MRCFYLAWLPWAVLFCDSIAHGDFIYLTTREPVTSGLFAGDLRHTLSVYNDGQNGSGHVLRAITVQPFGQAGGEFLHDPNAIFYIRTWNGSEADLSNQADRAGDQAGSYVRFGPIDQWTLVSSDPAENGQPFTDGQALRGGFTVTGTVDAAAGGADDSRPQLLAITITPPKQLNGYEITATSDTGQFTALVDEMPEPSAVGLVGLVVTGACLRRRR